MIFDNIHILLTFLGDDLREGHLREQTVGKEYIVKNSVQIRLQLLDGLKSSSNQVTVQILRTCPSIEDIVATDSDIRAVLKCGDLVLFTGYLSTNYSWTVTDSGKQALNITLEDVGTRLFGKNYLRSGSMLFKCKADIALRSICASAGVTVSPSCSRIQDEIIKVIESGKSCRDILSQMLYELGYVYYFNNLGELKVFQIDCSTTENAILIDREKLFTLSGKAITVSKSVRQYKSAKVTLKSVGEVHDFLVYRNTTGQDSSHEFCYMELEKDNYFDGLEIYTREEWAAETSDELRVPARIEACNAESRTDVVGSGKIISVSDIQVEFETDGNISCSISAPGGPYLEILAHNQGTSAKHINRMDVYGTVLYEKETIIVRTSDGTVDSLSSDNLLEETLEYIHDKTKAQQHANLAGQYHRYCNAKYSFNTSEDLELGSIIRLQDNAFSGLDVYVLVTAKAISDSSSIIQYSGVGIKAFNLSAEVYHQKSASGNMAGLKGKDGKSAYQVAVENGFVGTEEEWLDSLQGEDGDSITISSVQYAASSSNTSTPTSWQDNVPTVEDGGYLWTKTTYSDGSISYSYVHQSVDADDFVISFEYAVSDSYTTAPSAGWDQNISDTWTKGKYVWRRLVKTYSNGRVERDTPIYDEQKTSELEALCVFSFKPNRSTYVRNLRLQGNTAISFEPQIWGYGNITVSFSATEGSFSDNVLFVPFSVSSNSITITMRALYDSSILSVQTILSCIDDTKHDLYLGILPSVPTSIVDGLGLLEGDFFIPSESITGYVKNMPYRYNGSSWEAVTKSSPNFAQILYTCAYDLWKSNNETIPSEVQDFYSYYEQIISRYIATTEIVLVNDGQKSGSIHSNGFTEDIVDGLIDGSIDPSSVTQGFYGDSSGKFAAFLAYLHSATIKNAYITDATVSGILDTVTFYTQLSTETGDSYVNNTITSGTAFWSAKRAINTIRNMISDNNVVALSTSHNGTSRTKAMYVTDSTNQISSGTIVAGNSASPLPFPSYVRVTSGAFSCNGSPVTNGVYAKGSVLTNSASADVTATWDVKDTPQQYGKLVFAGSIFYYMNYGNTSSKSYFSTDYGETWTILNIAQYLQSGYYAQQLVGYANGVYILRAQKSDASGSNIFYYSTDGTSFYATNISGATYFGASLVFFKGYYYLLARYQDSNYKNHAKIFKSQDGVTWSLVSTEVGYSSMIVTDGNRLVYDIALSYDIPSTGEIYSISHIRHSTDGNSWSDIELEGRNGSIMAVYYLNSKFIYLREESYYATGWLLGESTDGANWTFRNIPKVNNERYIFAELGFLNGKYVVRAEYRPTSDYYHKIYYSSDLYTWNVVSQFNPYSYETTSNASIAISDRNVLGRFPSIDDRFHKSVFVSTPIPYASFTYDYSQYDNGLNLLNASSYESEVVLTDNEWKSIAFSASYNGTTIFNSSDSSQQYYRYAGMKKTASSETIASGSFFRFSAISASVVKFNPSNPSSDISISLANIRAVVWSGSSGQRVLNLSYTDNSGNDATLVINDFSSSDFYKSISLSFTAISRTIGNYTKSIYPMSTSAQRAQTGEIISLGSGTEKFDEAYIDVVYGERVYGAYWNDIADAVQTDGSVSLVPGRCYVKDKSGIRLSSKYCEKGILGIHSDTYGFLIGKKNEGNELYVALGGFVLAYVDKVYAPGTPLTCTNDGVLTRIRLIKRILHPERIVGVFHKTETCQIWNGVKVCGRHWIKVR